MPLQQLPMQKLEQQQLSLLNLKATEITEKHRGDTEVKKSHITIPYLNVKGLFLHKCVLIRQIMYSSAYYFDEFFNKDAILTKRRNIMKCIEIKNRSRVNNGFQID